MRQIMCESESSIAGKTETVMERSEVSESVIIIKYSNRFNQHGDDISCQQPHIFFIGSRFVRGWTRQNPFCFATFLGRREKKEELCENLSFPYSLEYCDSWVLYVILVSRREAFALNGGEEVLFVGSPVVQYVLFLIGIDALISSLVFCIRDK